MSRAAQCGHWPRASTPRRSSPGLRDSVPTLAWLYTGLPPSMPTLAVGASLVGTAGRALGRWPRGTHPAQGSLHSPRGVHGGQVRTGRLPEGGSPEAGPGRWAERSGEGLPARWKGRSRGASALEGEARGGAGQPRFHNLGAAGRGVGVGGAALSAGRRGRCCGRRGSLTAHLSLRQRSAGPTSRRGLTAASIFLDLALSPVYCSGGQFTLIADRGPLDEGVGAAPHLPRPAPALPQAPRGGGRGHPGGGPLGLRLSLLSLPALSVPLFSKLGWETTPRPHHWSGPKPAWGLLFARCHCSGQGRGDYGTPCGGCRRKGGHPWKLLGKGTLPGEGEESGGPTAPPTTSLKLPRTKALPSP